MRLLLEIYFAINIFCAGHEFKNQMDWAREPAEKLLAYMIGIKNILIFLPHMALIFLYALLKWAVWDPMNNKLQVGFFIEFYFTKRWDNVAENELYRINLRVKNRPVKDDKKIGSRVFMYCTKLINERNNYTFTEKPADF